MLVVFLDDDVRGPRHLRRSLTGVAQPIIYTETNGVWATPVEVQGSAAFNTNGLALPGGLDCTSVGNCARRWRRRGGDLHGRDVEPWLVSETNGVWGPIASDPGRGGAES